MPTTLEHDDRPPTTTPTDAPTTTTAERTASRSGRPEPVTSTVAPRAGRPTVLPWLAVTVIAIAVAVVAVVWAAQTTPEPPADPSTSASVSDPGAALQRLVQQGYLPSSTVAEAAATGDAIALGLVPRERFDGPALRGLQVRGLVPIGPVERSVIDDLYARGLVPRERFDDAALRDLQTGRLVPTGNADE